MIIDVVFQFMQHELVSKFVYDASFDSYEGLSCLLFVWFFNLCFFLLEVLEQDYM